MIVILFYRAQLILTSYVFLSNEITQGVGVALLVILILLGTAKIVYVLDHK